MVSLRNIGLAALLGASAVLADTISCGPGSPCPESAPCCNAQGQCGSDDDCQGGCNARFSFKPDSCAPMPACKAGTYTFPSGIVKNIEYYQFYQGDSNNHNFTYTGEVLSQNDDAILTMRQNSVGTVLFSTFYIWYGKVSVTMKTSHLAGVVSDFILMSNVKDEIDYEFVGTELEVGQTNYYFEGLLNWDNEVNGAISSSSYDNFHTYTIDWNPDSVTWLIDGNAVRTLQKSDTLNQTTGIYQYPQTPARIQLAIWPGGASNQGEGTIEWAGGPIDWNAPDLSDPGYYFIDVQNIEVECYDPPSDAKISGSKSYIYTSSDGLEADVEVTDDDSYIPVSGAAATASSSENLMIVSGLHPATSTKKSTKSATSSESLAVVSAIQQSSSSSPASSADPVTATGSSDSTSIPSAVAAATSGSSSHSGNATATATQNGVAMVSVPLAGAFAAVLGLLF